MTDRDAQPSENVAVALRGFAAFSRGEIDESLDSIHPEIEWHLTFLMPDMPAGKTIYRGRDEVRTVWNAFRSVWEELTIDIEEVLWEGPDVVVAKARFSGRGEGSRMT